MTEKQIEDLKKQIIKDLRKKSREHKDSWFDYFFHVSDNLSFSFKVYGRWAQIIRCRYFNYTVSGNTSMHHKTEKAFLAQVEDHLDYCFRAYKEEKRIKNQYETTANKFTATTTRVV